MDLQNNIKQIGSISKGSKIYIEDYVMTFIKYMEEKYVCDELTFALLGNLKMIDDEEVLFISGIAQGKNTEKRGSISVLSEKGWQDIEKIREKYFKTLEVVGWAYIQPGYGDFLNENHISYHLDTFKNPYQVLYITDPLDKSQCFYRQKPDSPELKPINGYFIYYNRNEEMHEYLLDVKKEGALQEEPKENLTENVDSMINAKLRGDKAAENTKKAFKLPFDIKALEIDEKNALSLMSGLSFALLFVTLIVGGGLLKSNSRITALEKQLGSLGRSYVAMRNEMDQRAEEVFAAAKAATETQTEVHTEAQTEEPTEPPTEAPIAKEEKQEEQEPSYRDYTVKAGDTLIYLSRYFYGNDEHVEDIMEANNMSDGDYLIEGKQIKIPE